MTLRDIWEIHYESDFAKGLKLLIDHSGQRLLTKQALLRMQMLAVSGSEIDAYNLGKLAAALRAITIDNPDKTPDEPTDLPLIASPKVADRSFDEPQSASEEVKASPLAIQLHKEHSHWHAIMVNTLIDEERAEAAGQILDINKRLDREYDRLRAIARGETPAYSLESYTAEQTADNFRQKHSIRTRISTLKNLIKKASGPRLAQLEKELAEKQAKLEEL